MRFAGVLTADEFWSRRYLLDEGIRAGLAALPVHGLDGWTGPRMIADWSWEAGVLTSGALGHGDPGRWGPYVTVHVASGEPRVLVARLRLTALVAATGAFHDLAPLLIEAPRTRLEICVGGRPRAFAAWSATPEASSRAGTEPAGVDADHWFATAPLGEHHLVVEAHTVRPAWINLMPVRDIEAYLAGLGTRLRQMRHEA